MCDNKKYFAFWRETDINNQYHNLSSDEIARLVYKRLDEYGDSTPTKTFEFETLSEAQNKFEQLKNYVDIKYEPYTKKLYVTDVGYGYQDIDEGIYEEYDTVFPDFICNEPDIEESDGPGL